MGQPCEFQVFDAQWQRKLHELYTERKLTDVVLAVGDRSVAAHRVILATVSPHLQALFGNGMAESQSRVVELQEVSWAGVKAIVDFAYTGTVALSGSTVVAIIQAANLLQVEAVERAAVDFLVQRLDAGNVLSAMALGEHLKEGNIGRELWEWGQIWMEVNFPLVAAEPSFLALPAAEVAEILASDDVDAEEEEVFAAVMAWVKADEAGRKAELDRLLQLVRFPMMRQPAAAIMAEPLAARHPFAAQLLAEVQPDFAGSALAAACPRMRPRRTDNGMRDGQQLGGLPVLAFTRFHGGCYATSCSRGGTSNILSCRNDDEADLSFGLAAVCAEHIMSEGRHAAEFTVVASKDPEFADGLGPPGPVKRFKRFPPYICFVQRICVGAQGA
jgi:hypothetical protein